MAWTEDVLGAEFSAQQLPVVDSGTHSTVTLVRHDPSMRMDNERPQPTVLYVHGWSDYFANPELAKAVAAAGFRFYALDLHGHGRNLTDDVLATGAVPGMAADLSEYRQDFETALTAMASDGAAVDPEHLVVIAHSTGGLTMSLLQLEQPGQVAGLALATPWIAPQGFNWLDPLIVAVARAVPKSWHAKRLPVVVNTNYHRTLSADREGTWRVDPRWRPRNSFPITLNLLASTARARLRLLELHRAGHTVGAPVLLQSARRSLLVPWWSKQMHHVDTVLDVAAIRRRATVLSPQPTVIAYDGAIHDVHRSAPSVRAKTFADLQSWLTGLDLG